jgi:hypothetical protein
MEKITDVGSVVLLVMLLIAAMAVIGYMFLFAATGCSLSATINWEILFRIVVGCCGFIIFQILMIIFMFIHGGVGRGKRFDLENQRDQ